MTSGTHRTIHQLESIWQTGAQFLDNFELEEGIGVFFHPVSSAGELPDWALEGAVLSVLIRFVDRDTEFHLHARILERVTSGERVGLRLSFLEEQQQRQELVLTCARGQSLPYYRRQHRRIACDLPARLVLSDGNDLPGDVASISKGGIFLAMDDAPVGVETVVHLMISFPGTKRPLRVKGRVVSVVQQGPLAGLSIEFLFSSKEQRSALWNQIDRLGG